MNASRSGVAKGCPKKGFTLVELVIVIAVLGIVSVYAVMRSYSVADVTLPSQAQKMAMDIRHAQAIASTGGASLCFVTDANAKRYYLSAKGASGCATTPVTDPATGSSFDISLQKNVTFSVGAGTTLIFNSLGAPSGSATYTLSSGSAGTETYTVSVEANTGKVMP